MQRLIGLLFSFLCKLRNLYARLFAVRKTAKVCCRTVYAALQIVYLIRNGQTVVCDVSVQQRRTRMSPSEQQNSRRRRCRLRRDPTPTVQTPSLFPASTGPSSLTSSLPDCFAIIGRSRTDTVSDVVLFMTLWKPWKWLRGSPFHSPTRRGEGRHAWAKRPAGRPGQA